MGQISFAILVNFSLRELKGWSLLAYIPQSKQQIVVQMKEELEKIVTMLVHQKYHQAGKLSDAEFIQRATGVVAVIEQQPCAKCVHVPATAIFADSLTVRHRK